jgi:hypothetical protein
LALEKEGLDLGWEDAQQWKYLPTLYHALVHNRLSWPLCSQHTYNFIVNSLEGFSIVSTSILHRVSFLSLLIMVFTSQVLLLCVATLGIGIISWKEGRKEEWKKKSGEWKEKRRGKKKIKWFQLQHVIYLITWFINGGAVSPFPVQSQHVHLPSQPPIPLGSILSLWTIRKTTK